MYQGALSKVAADDEDLNWFQRKAKERMDALAGTKHPETMGRKSKALLKKLTRAAGGDPSDLVYNPELLGTGPAFIESGILNRLLHKEDHPHYVPEGKTGISVDPGRYPLVHAHEIGHAIPEDTAGRVLRRASVIARGPAGVVPPMLLAGYGAYKGKLRYPLIGAGLSALAGGLTLGEESRATGRGRELLKQVGYTPTEEEESAVGDAFRTYVTSGLAGMGIPLATYLVLRRSIR
jgi:hypothetical protein